MNKDCVLADTNLFYLQREGYEKAIHTFICECYKFISSFEKYRTFFFACSLSRKSWHIPRMQLDSCPQVILYMEPWNYLLYTERKRFNLTQRSRCRSWPGLRGDALVINNFNWFSIFVYLVRSFFRSIICGLSSNKPSFIKLGMCAQCNGYRRRKWDWRTVFELESRLLHSLSH